MVDVIFARNCVVMYVLYEALHCYAGNARSVILHEIIFFA